MKSPELDQSSRFLSLPYSRLMWVSLLITCLLMVVFPVRAEVIKENNWDGATPKWDFSNDVAFFDNTWGGDGRYDTVPETTWSGDLDFANLSSHVLGVNDLYDEGDNGTSGEARVTFNSVDVSSYNNVEITFNYDAEALDSGDYVDYELFEDGTGQGQTTVVSNTTAQGTQTISVTDSTSSVYFELIFAQNGVSDYIGIDNIKLTGTPTGLSISSPADHHDTNASPIEAIGTTPSSADVGDSVVVSLNGKTEDTVSVKSDSTWVASGISLDGMGDSLVATLKESDPTSAIVSQDTITVNYDTSADPGVSNFSVADTGPGTVTLNWDAINTTDKTGFSNYKIYYSKTTPVDTSTASIWDETDDSSLSDSSTVSSIVKNLESGVTYYFKMTWQDGATNEAPLTGELSATTQSIPSPPLKKNWDGATPKWGFSNDVAFFDNTWGGDGRYDTVPETTWSGDLNFANLSSKILGVNDLDDEGDNGTTGEARVTFNKVDVSAHENVTINFHYDAEGLDSGDYIDYELFEDGTGQGQTTVAENTTAQGTQTISVQDSTSTVFFELIFAQNGTSDYIGVDNVEIEGGLAPAVDITSPADGHDTTASTVTVNGNATSAATGDSVVLSTDLGSVDTVAVQSDSTWTAKSVDLAEGSNSVVANLKDTGPTTTTVAQDTITVTYDPNTAPNLDLLTPDTGAYVGGSDVSGTYVLTDPDNDPGTVAVEVSDDSGASWSSATVSGELNSVSSSSSGDTHSFQWDSLSDLGTVEDTQVKLRIRAFDGSETGAYDTTSAFTVDNRAPPRVDDLGSTAAVTAPDTGASLYWSYSSNDVQKFRLYRVERTSDTSSANRIDTHPVESDTHIYFDSTVVRGDSHYYYVTGVDTAGNESDSSNATTPPHVALSKVQDDTASHRPGDTIEYTITYTNDGFGPTGTIELVDAMPDSTALSDTAEVVSGPTATIEYSPDNGTTWQTSSYPRADIDQVRWTITEDVDPRASGDVGSFRFRVILE